MIQRDEEISTTFYLSILNRYMKSQISEVCKYMTTQEFKCTSGHRFGRTRVAVPNQISELLSYV